jgi:hypothetical protein
MEGKEEESLGELAKERKVKPKNEKKTNQEIEKMRKRRN